MSEAPGRTGGQTALFLCHSAKPSGAELALLRLANRMTTRRRPGRLVVVFAEDGPMVERFRRAGVHTEVVPAPTSAVATRRGSAPLAALGGLLGLLRYGRRLARRAEELDVSVVVARSIKSMLYGAVVARSLGVPLVWSVHDRIAADHFGRVPAAVVRALGRVLPDAYVVNSRCTLATVRTGTKPVLLAPPAMDPEAFGPPRPIDATAEVANVVMVGRLAPWKGQHVFLEAFTRVFAGTSTRATVVGGALFGEEDYEASLHRTVVAGPCAGQVELTGHVDDVADHVLRADVLVHASTVPEPFGLVVVEGMAAGCAVVATTPGGPAEVITDGVDGLLVPCGEVDALEAALRRLATDPRLRSDLGRAGQVKAREYDVACAATMTSPWLDRVALRSELPLLLHGEPTGLSVPRPGPGSRAVPHG